MIKQKQNYSGFTLIELLVVISIIQLIASILIVQTHKSRIKARDALRRADMVQLAKALELYYNDNGGYPSTSLSYRSETHNHGPFGYSGPNGYIPNLAPTYIAKLPSDPLLDQAINSCPAGSAGFYYVSDGVNYRIKDYCTAEELLVAGDQFYDPAIGHDTFVIQTAGAIPW